MSMGLEQIHLFDNLRNILIIVTTLATIITLIVKASNIFFVEIIKNKFKNHSINNIFVGAIITSIINIIFWIDVLGMAIVIFVFIISFIVNISSASKSEIMQNIVNSMLSGTDLLFQICFLVFTLLFMAVIIGIMHNFKLLKEEYLKVFKEGENLNIRCSKLSDLQKRFKLTSGISAFFILLFSIFIYGTVSDMSIHQLLLICLFWISTLFILLLSGNLREICEELQENQVYTLDIEKDKNPKCRIFLDYKDYYMMFENGKERYIKKSEVKGISKEVGNIENMSNSDNFNKKLILLFHTIKKYVIRNVLFEMLILSLASILIQDLYLANVQAPYNFIYVFGRLYYNLCLSYCAAYIFYLLTVNIPNNKKQIRMYKYFNNKIITLAQASADLVKTIIKASKMTQEEQKNLLNKLDKGELSAEELKKACTNITPQDSVVYISGIGVNHFNDYFELIDFIHNCIKINANDVLKFSECLSIDIVELIGDIEDCYNMRINLSKGATLTNINLGGYEHDLIEVCSYSKKLVEIFKNNTKKQEKLYHNNYIKKNKNK